MTVIPAASPFKKILIFFKNLNFLRAKKIIQNIILKINNPTNRVEKSIFLRKEVILIEILSNSIINPAKIIIRILRTSIALSATIVPSDFSRGIFSYLEIIVPLAISPALGIV